jgi:superfamily I DNA/RNA helicase
VALTKQQRDALWIDGSPASGWRIVSARPGTGKTTTLTDYCLDLFARWSALHKPWQGMAVLSYTNVAKDELERKIRELGSASGLLSSPHFVGTIDSFVNQYLFLPFGAGQMDCKGRPRLAGEPYRQWQAGYALQNGKPSNAFSPIFFDCYGLDVAGAPILIDRSRRRVSAKVSTPAVVVSAGNSAKIVAMKEYVWSRGYATQNDANYIAYSTLAASTGVSKALIERFPIVIVDEAQDMTEVQHALLDQLAKAGHKHLVLVGDEYQAIYEWNTAKPRLFVDKKSASEWQGQTISDTFRCSTAVCSVLANVAADGASMRPAESGKNASYTRPVEIRTFEEADEADVVRSSVESMASALAGTAPHDGNKAGTKTIAVVARSRSQVAQLQSFFTDDTSPMADRVSFSDPLTRQYLKVLHRLLARDVYGAIVGYETLLLSEGKFATKSDMRTSLAREWAGSVSIQGYRDQVLTDVLTIQSMLPKGSSELDVAACAAYCSVNIEGLSKNRLRAVERDCMAAGGRDGTAKAGPLSQLFDKDERRYLPHPVFGDVRVVFSTVHGVKGETYDGVVLHVRRKTGPCGCDQSSSLWSKVLTHNLVECEGKRIVYVALSRAAQDLYVVAPAQDLSAWQNIL